MTRYEIFAKETADRIEELKGRAERFAAHSTLYSRVPGILAEALAALQSEVLAYQETLTKNGTPRKRG